MANDPNEPAGTTSETERESIRSEEDVTNRESTGETEDEEFEDVDPDSAESDIDRDDSIDEI